MTVICAYPFRPLCLKGAPLSSETIRLDAPTGAAAEWSIIWNRPAYIISIFTAVSQEMSSDLFLIVCLETLCNMFREAGECLSADSQLKNSHFLILADYDQAVCGGIRCLSRIDCVICL